MLSKEDIMNIVESAIEENSDKAEKLHKYIDLIKNMNQNEYDKFLKDYNIKDENDVRSIISSKLTETKKEVDNSSKSTGLNDVVGYGITGNTLHIHVMPKELKEALTKTGRKEINLDLIDALEKIQVLLQSENYENITTIYAVSGILRGALIQGFEDLNFDTRVLKTADAKNDSELGKFYDRFNNGKYIGRAAISKEYLLSDEWNKNKDKIKSKLETELGIKSKPQEKITQNNFLAKLKDETTPNEDVAKKDIDDFKLAQKSHEMDISDNINRCI